MQKIKEREGDEGVQLLTGHLLHGVQAALCPRHYLIVVLTLLVCHLRLALRALSQLGIDAGITISIGTNGRIHVLRLLRIDAFTAHAQKVIVILEILTTSFGRIQQINITDIDLGPVQARQVLNGLHMQLVALERGHRIRLAAVIRYGHAQVNCRRY